MNQPLKKRNGFTLVELILVIVIIAILAAVAIPKLIYLNESARRARVHSEHRQLIAAIQLFQTRGEDPIERAKLITSIDDLAGYMNVQPSSNGQTKATVSQQLASNTSQGGTITVAHEINNGVLTSTFISINEKDVPSQTWIYAFK